MTWVHGVDDRPSTRSLAQVIARSTPDLRLVTEPDLTDHTGVAVCSDDVRGLTSVLRTCAAANIDVVVVTEDPGLVDPWQALAVGACDVLPWNDDPQPILSRVQRLREVDQLVRTAADAQSVIGHSRALRSALRDLVIAARFGNGPILILGETGTGKELAARVAHEVASDGHPSHLVVVDCTTIVPTLSGSELFGHEKGAFTGAVGARTGAFAAANGGTLFLDEIGELALDLQPALLRVVQEGTYKRVGADRWQRSTFRLICATNRPLADEVAAGRFRADLYHRIAACRVTLPPLADRPEDITTLFTAFLGDGRRTGSGPVELSPAVERALLARSYPGNLRDLRQLAGRVATRHTGSGPITPGDLPPEDRPTGPASDLGRDPDPDLGPDLGPDPDADLRPDLGPDPDPDLAGGAGVPEQLAHAVREQVRNGTTLKQLRERVADLAVSVALADCGGNVRAAATRLGVTDRALHLRMAQRSAAERTG